MTYTIVADPQSDEAVYTPYGGSEEFMYAQEPEVIISGPAETGKTMAACWKLHLIASKYPKAQLVIARAIQADLYSSVLQTFERVIEGAPVEVYGGSRPERYIYPNGAIIWLAGLDKPGKALSSERDIIYVNQAEQLKLDSWEVLTTRTTGRGAVMPYTQTIGDCNPGGSKHWILQRAKDKNLRLITTRHQDNPTLYNRDGTLTKQGERSISALQSLTGIRRKRLFEGLWATAEGAVYDMFDHSLHVTERDENEMVRWHLALDEGYTNPAVILLIGEDSDKRWHIESEWYETGKLQDDVVKQARALWLGKTKRGAVAVDEAAAGLIAALNNAGLPAVGAKGRILDGIAKIQNRLVVQGDGRPRLTVSAKCVNTINEFESYVWKPEKDVPVDADNHSLGAIRYLEDALADNWIVD